MKTRFLAWTFSLWLLCVLEAVVAVESKENCFSTLRHEREYFAETPEDLKHLRATHPELLGKRLVFQLLISHPGFQFKPSASSKNMDQEFQLWSAQTKTRTNELIALIQKEPIGRKLVTFAENPSVDEITFYSSIPFAIYILTRWYKARFYGAPGSRLRILVPKSYLRFYLN